MSAILTYSSNKILPLPPRMPRKASQGGVILNWGLEKHGSLQGEKGYKTLQDKTQRPPPTAPSLVPTDSFLYQIIKALLYSKNPLPPHTVSPRYHALSSPFKPSLLGSCLYSDSGFCAPFNLLPLVALSITQLGLLSLSRHGPIFTFPDCSPRCRPFPPRHLHLPWRP